ncbi:MAG: glycosyltransferase [Ferruginibacter sp.]|nr:glycosyltransferase [Bacteroidota bacterium]MBX2917931.1 glycosyltransferase [Ferruginibacter sp.]MCB0709193.1 glycosyltransferase [Chitinophagaceae bacterium]MCC7377949.1 glycosyltransferase [Chitinophagaceae bacterium]
MSERACNILIMGVSCFDGMASSMRVRNLVEPLVQKKLITASNLIYQKDNKEPIGNEGVKNDIRYKVIGFRLRNIFSVFPFLYKGLSFIRASRLKQSKNILYNYNYPDIKNIFFILYAKMIGYKVIFDIIEDNNYQAHTGFVNKFRLKTSLFIFRFSKYFANAMIGISNHLYELIQKSFNNKVPAYLIPITVNLQYFKVDNKIDENNKNLKIFYGGSFGQKDGLEYLISAFDEVANSHPGIELIFSGLAHTQDFEKITQQIEKAKNKNRIIYKGYLSTREYYNTLNACDIFCMTRVNSKFANAGFPFKLGEFLASGKAVIATSVGDVPAYLHNEKNALLIAPESVEEIATALNKLINNPGMRKELGYEARKTAEQNFDSEKISNNLLSIFNSVL